jgi:hypothetical protein
MDLGIIEVSKGEKARESAVVNSKDPRIQNLKNKQ